MFGRATIRLGIGPHSSLLYFRNLDDEHGCQMLFIWCKTIIFTAKRSIKSTFKNAKFDLFRSEKANWQIRLRIEIG